MVTFYDTQYLKTTHPLIHRYFAEGLFGMDTVKHADTLSVRYFSESRRVPLNSTPQLETFEYTNIYQVLPVRAACFPFSFDRHFQIERMRNIPGNAWLQVLARRRNERWRDMVAAQYDAHLMGVTNPSSISLLRRAQEWVAQKLQEAGDWAEGGVVIPESERKETEDGFQLSIRIAVQGEKRQHKHILPALESLFRPLYGSNEYKIESVSRSILKNMQDYSFAADDKKSFILCTSELKAFFPERKEDDEEYSVQIAEAPALSFDQDIQLLEKNRNDSEQPRKNQLVSKLSSSPQQLDTETEETKRNLEKALRKVGFLDEQYLNITGVTKGPTLQQVTIQLPRGTTMNGLVKQQKNLQAELGVEEVTIIQGKEAGTAALLFRRNVRNIVWLEPILESPEYKNFAKQHDLPFVAGVDVAGKPIFESLVRLKHIIAAGTTGGGKTEWLISLLFCLLSAHSTIELHIYAIDPKRIALSMFRPFPHVQKILTDMDEAVELLREITEEMDRRYELMEEACVESIQEYAEETGEKLPYIVVAIDEYADLSMQNALVEHLIIRLGQLARQAGIHVVLATQRPAANILTSKIKTNLLSRFCFLCASPGDYQTVFGRQMHPALLGKGDGICVREGVPGMTRFQAALLADSSKNKREKLNALLAKWVQEDVDEGNKLDKLAAFITETGETRIREIQKAVGVRTAKAQEMMQQLVAMGILLPPDDENPRYRLAKTGD